MLNQTIPLWRRPGFPKQPALHANKTTDVCIIGAGITGLTTAYFLLKQGIDVILLEAGEIACGESGRTTAHLSNVMDGSFAEIERLHGEERLRAALASHTVAIDTIESMVAQEGIACGFERIKGYLFSPLNALPDVLEREYEMACRAGLYEVRRVNRVPWKGFHAGRAIQFEHQAQLEPLPYLAGLVHFIEANGGEIFTDTHVLKVEGGELAFVETSDGFKVNAHAVIVATHSPINDLYAPHTKQTAYRTFVLSFPITKGAIEKALYWDTEHPYHYVRLQPSFENSEQELLIVGGEDHRTGEGHDASSYFFRLEAWARERFPEITYVQHHWSGQILETIDRLPFIGLDPAHEANVYIATGYSGMGLTYGTVAGLLFADLIQGKQNRWTELYDPSRVRWGASGHFMNENLNVAAHYYLDRIPHKRMAALSDIPLGEGAILQERFKKVAVYRDEIGEYHCFSAVCPHLRGIVNWNPVEHTWDCPCHGSRFDGEGKVLNGPALHDLQPDLKFHPPRELITKI